MPEMALHAGHRTLRNHLSSIVTAHSVLAACRIKFALVCDLLGASPLLSESFAKVGD